MHSLTGFCGRTEGSVTHAVPSMRTSYLVLVSRGALLAVCQVKLHLCPFLAVAVPDSRKTLCRLRTGV